MVYVEGDATMSTYQDPNGQTRSSLNVVQRTYKCVRFVMGIPLICPRIGSIEVLKRPQNAGQNE